MIPMMGDNIAAGLSFEKRARLFAQGLRTAQLREPQDHLFRIEQRRAGQRVDAPCENQVRATDANIGQRGIERLHPRCAIAHHRPSWNFESASEAQRDDASDVDFVRRWARAAEYHLIELFRLKWQTIEQRAAGLHREIRRRKGAGPVPRFQERCARAVDYIDTLIHRVTVGLKFLCASSLKPATRPPCDPRQVRSTRPPALSPRPHPDPAGNRRRELPVR